MAVLHAARTGAFAVTAGEAAVQVLLRGTRGRGAFKHLLHQIDTPAWTIKLIAQKLVRWARRRAKTAVHALAQNGFGLFTFGCANVLGGQVGLHVRLCSLDATGVEDARWVKLFFEFVLNALLHRIEWRVHAHLFVGLAVSAASAEQGSVATRLHSGVTYLGSG